MSIWLWKVLDNRVVEACFGPSLAFAGLVVAAVLLPEGSGLERAAKFYAIPVTGLLIWEFVSALFRRR